MSANADNPFFPRQVLVEERIAETGDVFTLKLSLLDGGKLDFQPGQFTMLGLPGVGEAAFSFSSLPLEGGRSFLHTIRLAGNVTTAVSRLDRGDRVQIRGPLGRGWPLEKTRGKNVVIIAGGTGFAPLRPVIHYLRQSGKECKKLFVLYGAKSEKDLLFREELRKWRDSGEITLLIACEEAAGQGQFEIHQCLVTGLLNKVDAPPGDTIAFICGPGKMMGAAAGELARRGHDPGDIYVSLETRMKCGIGHCGHCQVGRYFVCKDGPVFAYADAARALDTPL